MLSTRFSAAGYNAKTLKSLAKDAVNIGGKLDEGKLTGDENFCKYKVATGEAITGDIATNIDEAKLLKKQNKNPVLYVEDYHPNLVPFFKEVEGVIIQNKVSEDAHLYTLLKNYSITVLAELDESGAGSDLNFGDEVTLDAENEKLYFGHLPLENNFTQKMQEEEVLINEMVRKYSQNNSRYSSVSQLNIKTNLDLPSKDIGYDIGLMRTEHMVLANSEQTKAFKDLLLSDENIEKNFKIFSKALENDLEKVIKNKADRKIRVRLLDLPANELFSDAKDIKKVNMMYGYARGVQMAMRRPEIYQAQAEAILKAVKKSPETEFEILVPTVRDSKELQFARDIVEEVAEELGVDDSSYKFGSMIETVSACDDIDNIVPLCDFINFGCNDLTSEMFTCSRNDKEKIQKLCRLANGFNPFDVLHHGVREKIIETNKRAKELKPNIDSCLCGDNILTDEGLYWQQYHFKTDSVSLPPNPKLIFKARIKYNYRLVDKIDGCKELVEKNPECEKDFRKAGLLPEIS